jgi:glycosyltransferase involved in cell wall biosynthesis
MRIALVTYALQVGGVETFLRLLGRYFSDLGHTVTFLETLEKGQWSASFVVDGFKVMRILPAPFKSKVAHSKNIATFLSDFDLVILNDAPLAQASLGLLPDNTVVIPVLHMHMTSMVRNAAGNRQNWDVISAVAPAGKASLVHFGIDPTRVVCIPNGIKVPKGLSKISTPSPEDRLLKVVYIGAVNHSQKGVLYLPDIFRSLVGQNIPITLDIVGDGPDLEMLRSAFSDFGGNEISFHGALPNEKALQILDTSDVLIMPSHFEGLPLVLLEAMSRGVVPVVSLLLGCTDFVVSQGQDGFLVPVGDTDGFARAITKLARDREKTNSMAEKAWKTTQTRFSHTVTGEAYLNLDRKCRRRRQGRKHGKRGGEVDTSLLGDFPYLPLCCVRPVRKLFRSVGLFKKPSAEPLLYGELNK